MLREKERKDSTQEMHLTSTGRSLDGSFQARLIDLQKGHFSPMTGFHDRVILFKLHEVEYWWRPKLRLCYTFRCPS